jgi:exopolyphosphatase / guanosine-5'-triphosphate,3'-diphosphate pyrophosphatase
MVNSTVKPRENIQAFMANGAESDRVIAAIDIGTNSFHMVVVKVQPSIPAFTIVDREKEIVRLGDRELETGNLTSQAMKRGIDALRRFQEVAKYLNAEHVIAVATSAVREAPNGGEFIKQVYEELNLQINLISGQEEARRIYLGVLSVMDFQNQPHIIIDIGGGSTEIVLADSQEPRTLSSTKVGAVRLTSEFVTTDPISVGEFFYLQAFIKGQLERAVDELRARLKTSEIPRLVGTSGTIETLAIIHAREKLGTVPSPLTGYQFTLKDLRELIQRLRGMSGEERASMSGMSERRAEIIVAGALILQEAMVMMKVDSLTVCERSLREGVIVDWMLTHGLIEDRLRYQSSIRQRSTLKIAQKYAVNLEYSQRVAEFALSLFDRTKGKLHFWGEDERELLRSAAILHNCGHFVSHGNHHKHSYYLIRYGELLGFTDTEIDIIANIARYHRKNPPKKKHSNYQSLPNKVHRQIVSQLSALLRIAVALDRRQIGGISEIHCEYDDKSQELHLWLKPTDADDDCGLELWSLDDKKPVFEEEYGVKLVVTLCR